MKIKSCILQANMPSASGKTYPPEIVEKIYLDMLQKWHNNTLYIIKEKDCDKLEDFILNKNNRDDELLNKKLEVYNIGKIFNIDYYADLITIDFESDNGIFNETCYVGPFGVGEVNDKFEVTDYQLLGLSVYSNDKDTFSFYKKEIIKDIDNQ